MTHDPSWGSGCTVWMRRPYRWCGSSACGSSATRCIGISWRTRPPRANTTRNSSRHGIAWYTVVRSKESSSSWSSTGNAPGVNWTNREEGYKRFARFMGDMARRYPQVRYWELWNEMDGGFTDLFGAGRADVSMRERGKLYAKMLQVVYPQIRKANPDAWVLVGGMSDWNEFPRRDLRRRRARCLRHHGPPHLWCAIGMVFLCAGTATPPRHGGVWRCRPAAVEYRVWHRRGQFRRRLGVSACAEAARERCGFLRPRATAAVAGVPRREPRTGPLC